MARSTWRGYPLTLSELHAEDACREEIRKSTKVRRQQRMVNR